MLHHLQFGQRVVASQNLVSTFATFLVMPYCLDSELHNYYCKKLGLQELKKRHFILCMKDNQNALPLQIRVVEVKSLLQRDANVCKRPLPESKQKEVEEWLSEVANERAHFEPSAQLRLHDVVIYDISLGISGPAVRQNALCLIDILVFMQSSQLGDSMDEVAIFHVARLLLAWFWGIGFSVDRMRKLLNLAIDDIMDDRQRSLEGANVNIENDTVEGFPFVLNFKWNRTVDDLRYFGDYPEEIVWTYNVGFNIIKHAQFLR